MVDVDRKMSHERPTNYLLVYYRVQERLLPSEVSRLWGSGIKYSPLTTPACDTFSPPCNKLEYHGCELLVSLLIKMFQFELV